MLGIGTDRNIIKGNTIVNVIQGGNGIRLDIDEESDNSSSDDNQVLDNIIISLDIGINVVGKRVVIKGNTINQSNENGIAVGRFTDLISEGVIIKGNSITKSGGFGIGISDGTTNTVVIGNTLAGNNDGPIEDQGTDTVFAGNIPNLM